MKEKIEEMIEERFNLPGLGSEFPKMTMETTHGKMKLPNDMKGKWFVLFSHPGDFTPVCTTEFIEFSHMNEEFEKLNTKLIGLSVDQVFSHIKWTEWIEEKAGVKVPFPIIADELGKVSKRLGMLHENMGTNTVRAVFIVDDKGIIRLMMYYPQEAGRDVNEILRSVKALQAADEYKMAIPEKWPNNRIMGDKGIIPPPKSEKAIEERRKLIEDKGYESWDWWFTFKGLDE